MKKGNLKDIRGGRTAGSDRLLAEKLLKEFPAKSNHELLPREKMMVDLPRTRIRMALSDINGTFTGDKPVMNYIRGVVMWEGN